MKLRNRAKDKKALMKALAGLSVNLSAAWLATAIISPNFGDLSDARAILLLTGDLLLGIVFLGVTYALERKLL